MGSFCKERNNLIGASNFLAWKKTIGLTLTKHEVMQYVTSEITEIIKDKAQDLAKCKKGSKGSKDHS